jgi:hypothetical protein
MNNTMQELVSDDSNDIHIRRAEQYMPNEAVADELQISRLHVHFGQVYLSKPVVIEKVRSLVTCVTVVFCYSCA